MKHRAGELQQGRAAEKIVVPIERIPALYRGAQMADPGHMSSRVAGHQQTGRHDGVPHPDQRGRRYAAQPNRLLPGEKTYRCAIPDSGQQDGETGQAHQPQQPTIQRREPGKQMSQGRTALCPKDIFQAIDRDQRHRGRRQEEYDQGRGRSANGRTRNRVHIGAIR